MKPTPSVTGTAGPPSSFTGPPSSLLVIALTSSHHISSELIDSSMVTTLPRQLLAKEL